eukprot:TRINITY_DN2430_c0_g2_i1.p1 TRINITY_DN2430_c0_g2~~TRINITY_DN2430_c0_g2_i1.p1  ORF type:complete len:523 (+),score=60.48 TRINITY_DN2430_c0_g2_i1:211-1569(+)
MTKAICPEWSDRLDSFSKFAGEGGFGQVYTTQVVCAEEVSDYKPNVAIKRMLLTEKDTLASARAEADMLVALDHPGVIKGYTSVEAGTSLPFTMNLLMEAAEGGDLFDLVADGTPIEEVAIARLMYQMSSAMAYLHEKKIVHGDIKLDNILLESPCSSSPSDCNAKLADMGLSCVLDDSETNLVSASPCNNPVGTVTHVAPELAHGVYIMQRGGPDYVREVSNDMWSLGVVLYQMLFRSFPAFIRVPERRIMHNLAAMYRYKRRGYVRREDTRLHDMAHKLLDGLLRSDPLDRVNASTAMQMSREWKKALQWKCHDYESGQDNEWCANVGIERGVQYRFFGDVTPCDGCWCCKRSASTKYSKRRPLPACWKKCTQASCTDTHPRCVEKEDGNVECREMNRMVRRQAYTNFDAMPLKPARSSQLNLYLIDDSESDLDADFDSDPTSVDEMRST